MTIEEAIKHAEEVADYDCYNEKQFKCAAEHRQLAEWLKQLKQLKEQIKWIPVSERFPEENGVYIVSYEDSVRLLEWFNGKWFFYPSNPAREETGTIIAWQLLPQPYKAESEEQE